MSLGVHQDVTVTSRDGDLPLHYLVRAKAHQADNVHYYKLLKTVLKYCAVVLVRVLLSP
jgi:hypothetical protein